MTRVLNPDKDDHSPTSPPESYSSHKAFTSAQPTRSPVYFLGPESLQVKGHGNSARDQQKSRVLAPLPHLENYVQSPSAKARDSAYYVTASIHSDSLRRPLAPSFGFRGRLPFYPYRQDALDALRHGPGHMVILGENSNQAEIEQTASSMSSAPAQNSVQSNTALDIASTKAEDGSLASDGFSSIESHQQAESLISSDQATLPVVTAYATRPNQRWTTDQPPVASGAISSLLQSASLGTPHKSQTHSPSHTAGMALKFACQIDGSFFKSPSTVCSSVIL